MEYGLLVGGAGVNVGGAATLERAKPTKIINQKFHFMTNSISAYIFF